MNDYDWNCLGSCKQHTGYKKSTLKYIYEKYGGVSTLIDTPKRLVQALKFIHRHPRWRDCQFDLQISPAGVSRHVLPSLRYLADVLDEIHWKDRLSPYNHTPHFPKRVTAIVDTTPVFVNHPCDGFARSLLFNGKYKDCCYKIQIGIDFLGRIVLFSGPHLGNTYDAHIWFSTMDEHPAENWEYFLGDGHYSCIRDFLTPPKQPSHGHMTEEEYWEYALLSHYRARVEHINAQFKLHEAFINPFRGDLHTLYDCLRVTAHITNVELHRNLRYPPFGPWAHSEDQLL